MRQISFISGKKGGRTMPQLLCLWTRCWGNLILFCIILPFKFSLYTLLTPMFLVLFVSAAIWRALCWSIKIAFREKLFPPLMWNIWWKPMISTTRTNRITQKKISTKTFFPYQKKFENLQISLQNHWIDHAQEWESPFCGKKKTFHLRNSTQQLSS